MILKKIVDSKKTRLQFKKEQYPLEEIMEKVYSNTAGAKHAFMHALKKANTVSIIAEVKKASPSKGIIKKDFDHLQISSEYEKYGASAMSILTEEDFFLGNDSYLKEIRDRTQMPLLRKDFVIDEHQIYESKVLGANAILLICRMLNEKELTCFYNIATQIGLDCLFETHNEIEVKRAIDAGAKIIGINNRDLDNFEVDIKTTGKLISGIPKDVVKVSESGINSAEDMYYLKNIGVDSVLIGEALMKADSVKLKMDEFTSLIRE